MTRNGKIACLPADVQDSLNQRLQRGDAGPGLLAWLNSLPEVQHVSQTRFRGALVSQQNLSAWKLGGYQDWLASRRKTDLASRFLLEAGKLGDPQDLSNGVSALLALELAEVATLLMRDAPSIDERWKRLKSLLNQIHFLRRDDHEAARSRLQALRAGRQRQPPEDDAAEALLLMEALRSQLAPGPGGLPHHQPPTGHPVSPQSPPGPKDLDHLSETS
jgi:hypothetical protein